MRCRGMRRKKNEERVLGPYPEPKEAPTKWRIVVVTADGKRRRYVRPTEEEALQLKVEIEGTLQTATHTTFSARDAFLDHLERTGSSPRTIEGYEWALKTFFDRDVPLRALTESACERRYQELVNCGRYSVDSHRNALKMSKTFLRWCVKQRFITANPLANVEGEGRRRRGKPQLRIDEARKFYETALPRAQAGDERALAALVCLLMGSRAGEVLKARARDVDDGGRLLWIEDAKTAAGRRVLEIPEPLQPLLKARAGDGGLKPLFSPRSRKWLWTGVKDLCKAAGVPRVPPHGLRGGVATAGRVGGMSPEAVAVMLGHANTRIQEQHYVNHEALEAEERRRRFEVIVGGIG